MFYKRKYKSIQEFKAIIEMKTPKNSWKWNQFIYIYDYIDIFLCSKDNFIFVYKYTLIRDRLQIFGPHWLQTSCPLISTTPQFG